MLSATQKHTGNMFLLFKEETSRHGSDKFAKHTRSQDLVYSQFLEFLGLYFCELLTFDTVVIKFVLFKG